MGKRQKKRVPSLLDGARGAPVPGFGPMGLILILLLSFSQPMRGNPEVSLPGSWEKAATALGQATGWRWECPDPPAEVPGPSLTANAGEKVPFRWADQLASRMGRGVVIDPAAQVIRLNPLGQGGVWIVAHSGPFRLVARGGARMVDFVRPREGLTRQVRLELGWEPGTDPLLLPSVWEEVTAQAGNRPEVSEKKTGASREPEVAGETVVPLPLTGQAGLPDGWNLRLKGKALVAAGVRELGLGNWPEVADLVRRGPIEGAKEGAFSCSLVQVARNGRRISLRVRVVREAGGPELESYQSWVVLNRLWLEDRLGEVIRPAGQVLELQDESRAEVTYHLVLPAGTENRPRVIRYRTLTGIREEKLSFELKGLPALP